MQKRKLVSVFLTFLLLISNLSIISGAEGYVNDPEEGNYPVPLYDIIHSIELYATEEKVSAVVETDDYCSLRVTITL